MNKHWEGNMVKDLGYDECISGKEYDRRIAELHRHASPMPSKEEDREIRRKELNLAIDHRLGVKFPQNRRDQLWEVMEHVERKRLWLGLKYVFKKMLIRKALSKGLVHKANGLAEIMVDEFGKILNTQELYHFFQLKPGEHPSLPVDSDEI